MSWASRRWGRNVSLQIGGARRDRTADLLHAMQALSQLSYGPIRAAVHGAPRWSLLKSVASLQSPPIRGSSLFVVFQIAVDQVGHVVVALLLVLEEGVVIGNVVGHLDVVVDRDVLLVFVGLDLIKGDHLR